ncbi:putative alpha beta-hydrolase [Erysiphe neolycopersici]|uniref:Putative alpha beta-hydrolase n=1 Tax=Erysiphe neolycopersici TaxID=212602 RepID=A0A420HDW8_9PEZI|nr:putative alpha beta-hydrolase [Erysiphe neolycopersici]
MFTSYKITILYIKAIIWRLLMFIGMRLHHLAKPRPPNPNFKLMIPSRLHPHGGSFMIVFYLPATYFGTPDDYKYPVVINFHGGGFTLGSGTDDARFAQAVVCEVNAIFVSIEYRLAPKYPFSVGVEDSADAVIYLAAHAAELRIDPHRMALSGFSAGGNFTFTVPLLLQDLKTGAGKRILTRRESNDSIYSSSYTTIAASSSTLFLPNYNFLRSASSLNSICKLTELKLTQVETTQSLPEFTLLCLISFYPPTDFRKSREQKRDSNPMPKKNLPRFLTDFFDEAYMQSQDIDLADPYLSPAATSDANLKAAYPKDILLYTCQYDMLNAEGVEFGIRLASEAIGKTVRGGLIKEVPHAFDKKPNPITFPEIADRCYREVCAELRQIFGQQEVL